jgi:CBS domain-containing protein
MTTPPTRLHMDNTISEAIEILLEHHMYNLPVVDSDEIFVGEFSARRIISLMLPASLTMESGLRNVSFVRETREDLKSRLYSFHEHPVSRYMATDITVVYPDSPVIDALMLLYQKYMRIAVVDRTDGRLLGGISYMTLLRALETLE